MRVTVYCPDRHLVYDGATPDGRGVGGGVTARVHVATALAARGHVVDVVCNCRAPRVHDGVRYRPLDAVDAIDTDVLVLHTTGDALDLRPITRVRVRAERHVVFVDGIDAPRGLELVPMDHLIAPSNFIRDVARDEWGIDPHRIFVSHHGVRRRVFAAAPEPKDLHRIAYATHPSKGLAPAIAVLRLLRRHDARFELHVYGGSALWGQPPARSGDEPGLVDHGLLGQAALATELHRSGFALYLQTRREPFGIAIAEALAAGCVTIASPVGAHPEIVAHERTGFLLAGDPSAPATHERAAALIRAVVNRPDLASRVARDARAAPLDWDAVAATWAQYWTWLAAGRPEDAATDARGCGECGGPALVLDDGRHCVACGGYRP